jgi:hypothetical protein
MEPGFLQPPSALPRRRLAPAGWAWAWAGLFVLAACGKPVSLGTARPLPFRFDAPKRVSELGVAENPTLTGDLTEIYFTSGRGTPDGNVWTSRRATPSSAFSEPTAVTEVNSPLYETSAAVSADGLSLWIGSDRDNATEDIDIWLATRQSRSSAWSTPSKVNGLNSTLKDLPRPPGDHGLTMPMSSERDSPALYRTYLATRASPNDSFTAPEPVPELAEPGRTVVDACLSDDGLAMFFTSGPSTGDGDLFVAWRETTSEPFTISEAVSDLNTAADERDPWLSPDGATFYFTSNRSGENNIYEAQVRPR